VRTTRSGRRSPPLPPAAESRPEGGARAGPADPDDLATVTVWGLLVEVHARGNRALEEDLAQRHGIPLTWFEVLLRLSRSPDRQQRVSELARQVSFSSGGFTRLADRMVEAGLVERRAHPTDRRGGLVVLTDAGSDLVTAAVATQARMLRDVVLAALPTEDLDRWAADTRRVRDALDAPATGG
jgi:DNA-binding MarR family transcriptional regulator